MVRYLNTSEIKERWVYRGMLESSWFPDCKSYCKLLKDLDFLLANYRRVYVSCTDAGTDGAKNIEDLTDLVNSNGTPYNCSSEENCTLFTYLSFKCIMLGLGETIQASNFVRNIKCYDCQLLILRQ